MITTTHDAPLPSPDPWASDAPDLRRCPFCAAPDPGNRRCRQCRAVIVVKVRTRKPRSVNLVNLFVVTLGRGPLILAVTFLFRSAEDDLLSPWMIFNAAVVPLLWLMAAGLILRWRWAWFLTMGFCLIDLLVQVGLQLVYPQHVLLPLAAIINDLMMIGMLLTVYDEVRIEFQPIDLPPRHDLPKTAIDAFNRGVAYSQRNQWYLAARMWQRAVALRHYELTYRRALGLAYLRLKELTAAAAELQAASQLHPSDAQTRELLDLLAKMR